MRVKRFTILTLFILLLAACNSPQESSPTENEEATQEDQTEENGDKETEDEEVEEETEVEEAEPAEEPNNSEAAEQEENNTTIEKNDDGEEDKQQELVDLAYEIFDAQDEKNYDSLESVLSKGSKLDKKNDKFEFENVTYPHEQEFLTVEDIGELEF